MKDLENKLMELNQKLPQLPENARTTLAKYFWVLAIISVVFNVMGILAILGIGGFSGVMLAAAGFGGFSLQIILMVITGVVGMGIVTVMEILAISPLKNMKYKGWYISFCAVLLTFALSFLSNLFSNSMGSIFSLLISTAISLYLLAQVREYFQ